jgi:NAD(P)-dependent dehydrogenase (short-subunit alcohol dehydrogenase family)
MTTNKHNHGTVLITGASSGIGRELALEFGAVAETLVAVARRLDRLEKLRADVGGGEKGYQFGGREGARCGVTLWPPVGRRKREEADCFPSQAGLSSLLTSGVR